MTQQINVKGTAITIIAFKDTDYISLTDMLKAKDGDFFIADWLRNSNTLEFLGIWEQLNNPKFNYGEFAIIKSQSGLNSYKISVKEWVQKTGSIGLRATAGRYGGTYAHKDIAFEFGMWISPEFKLYLIKEYQRLKEEETERKALGWDAKRLLAKANYKVHTDAVKEHLIPPRISKQQTNFIYADEGDILNTAMFGMTAKEWREQNPKKKGNLRDYASVTQLVCLAGLESLNAEFIRQGLPAAERLKKLNEIAIIQMRSLSESASIKRLER